MLQQGPRRKESPLQLIVPALDHLDEYIAALKRGWSSDNIAPEETAREELEFIEEDPTGFIASLEDREAKGDPIALPDGTFVARLPGYRRWMWDDGFCGSISFRWQPGTAELPAHCLGHIGYAVPSWKRNRGYATKALGMLLPEVAKEGLPHVDLTTDPDNLPSQRVITANGGRLVKRFTKVAAYGDNLEALLFRIPLPPA
ncbi:MAG: GNAT family N-acetyltransferase [Alphaproteobacteria bacterium 65-37]|jgi:predicted acetyltransferase|nr:MAG: GNAT family N-acetyltransferase [Alphaproteobacteria bacterium 65-37]